MTLTFDLKFWKYLSVTEYPYSMCMSSFMMIGWEMTEILHIEICGNTDTQTWALQYLALRERCQALAWGRRGICYLWLPCWHCSLIQNGRRRPFCQQKIQKLSSVYGSEMARNAIKSEFRTSKMADRSEMARNAIGSEFRTSKMGAGGHFVNLKKNVHVDIKWPEMRSKVNFWLSKWPTAVIMRACVPPMGGGGGEVIIVQYIWMSNACVKFEERSLNPSKVIALTTKLWRGGCCFCCCVADENIYIPGNLRFSGI